MSLRVDSEGLSATVWLDRPAKHNPISTAMWIDLAAIFDRLSADSHLRCVVIRGAGGRAFSAGADIAEFESTRGSPEAARIYSQHINGCMSAMAHCPHPIVAAIEGLCVGGGMEIITHCDLRYANASARFGVPVKRLGLSVDTHEMASLVHLVGSSTALELLLEGRLFDAEEALAKGVVNRIFPDAQFDGDVKEAVARICEGAPLVARLHKRMAHQSASAIPTMSREQEDALALFATNDYRAGAAAFFAKINPEFTGT